MAALGDGPTSEHDIPMEETPAWWVYLCDTAHFRHQPRSRLQFPTKYIEAMQTSVHRRCHGAHLRFPEMTILSLALLLSGIEVSSGFMCTYIQLANKPLLSIRRPAVTARQPDSMYRCPDLNIEAKHGPRNCSHPRNSTVNKSWFTCEFVKTQTTSSICQERVLRPVSPALPSDSSIPLPRHYPSGWHCLRLSPSHFLSLRAPVHFRAHRSSTAHAA